MAQPAILVVKKGEEVVEKWAIVPALVSASALEVSCGYGLMIVMCR